MTEGIMFGVISILIAIVGGGAGILLTCLAAIRSVKRESDEAMRLHRTEVDQRLDALRRETGERIEAIRLELSQRIEAIRIEMKTDRHNYVEQIDGVLKEIHEDIGELEKGVAVLVAHKDSVVALKSILHNGED
jgi:DNA anti-recombination protein RmuC